MNKESNLSSNNVKEGVAKNILSNIDDLDNQRKLQQNFNKMSANKDKDNEIFEPKEKPKSTLFMLNNNEPQRDSYEPYLKDVYASKKNNTPQLTSYGTGAVTLAIIALICSIFIVMHIAINPDVTDTSKMDFFFYLFFVILAPTIGLFGSVLCGIASAILGIIAIYKSYKRTISWVGFSLSIIVLAYVVIISGIYLLT